jgi:hypothetical protein
LTVEEVEALWNWLDTDAVSLDAADISEARAIDWRQVRGD